MNERLKNQVMANFNKNVRKRNKSKSEFTNSKKPKQIVSKEVRSRSKE